MLSNQAMMLPELFVLARLLPDCVDLVVLDLSFNGVNVDGVHALADAITAGLPRWPHLSRIDLRSNPIDGSGAEEAMRALRCAVASSTSCELLLSD